MKITILLIPILIALSLSGCVEHTATPTVHPSLCQQLTGQWQGMFQDNKHLFVIKNPHITLDIQYHQGVIIGKSMSSDKVAGTAVSGIFSGQCHNGTITHIYLYNPQRCGHYAPHGKISDNKLTLSLPYENAMTQTDFIITASRISQHPEDIPPHKIINQLVSCH